MEASPHYLTRRIGLTSRSYFSDPRAARWTATETAAGRRSCKLKMRFVQSLAEPNLPRPLQFKRPLAKVDFL